MFVIFKEAPGVPMTGTVLDPNLAIRYSHDGFPTNVNVFDEANSEWRSHAKPTDHVTAWSLILPTAVQPASTCFSKYLPYVRIWKRRKRKTVEDPHGNPRQWTAPSFGDATIPRRLRVEGHAKSLTAMPTEPYLMTYSMRAL